MIDAAIEKYLEDIRIPLRLSCQLGNGYPLVISLWYLYRDGKLYCASGSSSKLVRYLRVNSRVGFEVAADSPPYCGVRGYGRVRLYEDTGKTMLRELYGRYFSDTDSELFTYLTADGRQEMVVELTPEKVTTWNFNDRMSESVKIESSKICL